MKAFHNDSKIKDKYLARVKAHALADEIIKGKYWENGKGCAIGCTIHGEIHDSYETELGIPRILALLEDGIFEGLPLELAKQWPLRFLKSISVGADLSMVWPKFASRLLTDPVGGVIQYAKTPEQREVIQRVSDLYEAEIAGLEVDIQDFREAGFAASIASIPSAISYASYAATSAAFSAAYASYASSAAISAISYAFSAASVSYASSARRRAYIFQSELFLELLREAQ